MAKQWSSMGGADLSNTDIKLNGKDIVQYAQETDSITSVTVGDKVSVEWNQVKSVSGNNSKTLDVSDKQEVRVTVAGAEGGWSGNNKTLTTNDYTDKTEKDYIRYIPGGGGGGGGSAALVGDGSRIIEATGGGGGGGEGYFARGGTRGSGGKMTALVDVSSISTLTLYGATEGESGKSPHFDNGITPPDTYSKLLNNADVDSSAGGKGYSNGSSGSGTDGNYYYGGNGGDGASNNNSGGQAARTTHYYEGSRDGQDADDGAVSSNNSLLSDTSTGTNGGEGYVTVKVRQIVDNR